jgi:tagatose 1,6-diphosphate aldolase GatY/KbaY
MSSPTTSAEAGTCVWCAESFRRRSPPIPTESVQKAIDLGICKVNIATELKIPFSSAIKEYFNEHPDASDPREYLVPAKKAMYDVVVEKIKMCKSENKALAYSRSINK